MVVAYFWSNVSNINRVHESYCLTEINKRFNVYVSRVMFVCFIFVLHFSVLIFGLNTKKQHFLSFELHTIKCIVKYLVSSDEAVPAKCLC